MQGNALKGGPLRLGMYAIIRTTLVKREKMMGFQLKMNKWKYLKDKTDIDKDHPMKMSIEL